MVIALKTKYPKILVILPFRVSVGVLASYAKIIPFPITSFSSRCDSPRPLRLLITPSGACKSGKLIRVPSDIIPKWSEVYHYWGVQSKSAQPSQPDDSSPLEEKDASCSSSIPIHAIWLILRRLQFVQWTSEEALNVVLQR